MCTEGYLASVGSVLERSTLNAKESCFRASFPISLSTGFTFTIVDKRKGGNGVPKMLVAATFKAMHHS